MNSIQHQSSPSGTIDDLIIEMESLRRMVEEQAKHGLEAWPGLPPERTASAKNLLRYLAVRHEDIRPLQDSLTQLGLSSLGRIEPHVLATIDAVLRNLYLLNGQAKAVAGLPDVDTAFTEGSKYLKQNTARLFGTHPGNRRGHIIVTMPVEAADDYLMVHQLLLSGMNCMRINCAHDYPEIWSRMIETLRSAEHSTGLSCRILMDLGGPKLRLGPMETNQAVIKIRPVRAKNGKILRPARIWLTSVKTAFSEMPAADVTLTMDKEWLDSLKAGDRIRFRDVRGSKRNWRIREKRADGYWADSKKTSYVANGTVLQVQDRMGNPGPETEITGLAPEDSVCLIRKDDVLIVSAKVEPGKPAFHDSDGELLNPGRVSLAIPEVYRDVRLGEPIFFDDGRIAGIVEKRDAEKLQIRITHTRNPVEKLEGNRGVNLPDTDLNLAALSTKDLQDLEFAARHADMIGLSFTNSPDDVCALHQHLHKLGREDIGAVLKIETKRGFANLPAILMEALKFPACGVMIARGDLAVECGFERMSEVQEEILWVCESAHIPVIWATQVLEGLTKRGHASRAEVTDAAMAQEAEAVMLNKGEHVIEAVEMLDDILQRMQGHHHKKRSMLRKLHLGSGFPLASGNS
ncbi:MAG: pyruvate kinase [Xanthomonadales bacterium]|nr:pyruvate kinase [Xanthomonadales bacterium]